MKKKKEIDKFIKRLEKLSKKYPYCNRFSYYGKALRFAIKKLKGGL